MHEVEVEIQTECFVGSKNIPKPVVKIQFPFRSV